MKRILLTFLLLYITSANAQWDNRGGAVSAQDEGSDLGFFTVVDAVGAGVTATLSGQTLTLTIPGGGSATFTVEEDNVEVAADINVLDFGSGFDITAAGGEAEISLDMSEIDPTVTSTWIFIDSGTGGLTDYDLQVGDVATPDYGVLRLGDATLSRSSFSSGSLDIGGAVMFNNVGALDAGNDPGIQFLFVEDGSTIRMAFPESGVGNATALIRSVTIAGPSSLNNNIVTGDTWTTNNANLDFDTGGTGSDLFVQDDLEVGGIVYADSVLEEIAAAGVRIDGVLLKDGAVTASGIVEGATITEGGVAVYNDNEIDEYSEINAIVTDVTLSHSILAETLTNKTLDDFTNTVHSDAQHIQIYNNTGSGFVKGNLVYISGYNVGASLPEASLSDADAAATMPAIGVVTETIANGASGMVQISGRMSGLNTNTLSINDALYVSGTAGASTVIKPTGTALIQKMANVSKVAVSGEIVIIGAFRTNDIPNIPATNFWVGNASAVATPVAMSGHATMDNAGAVTIDHGGVDGLADDDHSAYENELNNSAGLIAALDDETGTLLSVFSDSPIFTTNITVPIVLVSNDVIIQDDLQLDSDAALIQLGEDQDVVITHVADTGILLALDRQVQFGDAAVFIESDDDSFLDLDADGGIRLNAAVTGSGTITATTSFIAPLFDAAGDEDMDYGSGDVDDHTFITDGTGTAEIVLPVGSIDGTEILDDTIDSDDYAAASIDNEHLANNAADTDEIAGFAVTEPKIGYFEWTKYVVFPDTLSTAGDDTLWFPTHYSATVTVNYIKAISDVDDMTVSVVKASEAVGAGVTLVDVVTTSTNMGNSKFWGEETSITAGTIAADDWIGLTSLDENANYISIYITGTR